VLAEERMAGWIEHGILQADRSITRRRSASATIVASHPWRDRVATALPNSVDERREVTRRRTRPHGSQA
jgi:hypothetical protein